MTTEKWIWMMEWCRKRKVPPGESMWWNMAEQEYNKMAGMSVSVDHAYTPTTTDGVVK